MSALKQFHREVVGKAPIECGAVRVMCIQCMGPDYDDIPSHCCPCYLANHDLTVVIVEGENAL